MNPSRREWHLFAMLSKISVWSYVERRFMSFRDIAYDGFYASSIGVLDIVIQKYKCASVIEE
jgi:hypothetical protein